MYKLFLFTLNNYKLYQNVSTEMQAAYSEWKKKCLVQMAPKTESFPLFSAIAFVWPLQNVSHPAGLPVLQSGSTIPLCSHLFGYRGCPWQLLPAACLLCCLPNKAWPAGNGDAPPEVIRERGKGGRRRGGGRVSWVQRERECWSEAPSVYTVHAWEK